MSAITLFTIGFTKKSAEDFFTLLSKAGVRRVIDIRLNNVSQLAGFAKKDDLRFFLKAIGGIDYVHMPELAPSKTVLENYKKSGGSWETYRGEFLQLIAGRRIEKQLSVDLLDRACLLCSEASPSHCHRSLVAQYLLDRWGDLEIVHLQ